MTAQRYSELMCNESQSLTTEELKKGWHFCWEWDGLLVGPEMPDELSPCHCLNEDHPVYNFRKS